MTKYVFVYHGGGMPESEAEGAKLMAAWNDWMGSLGTALTEGGNPIGQSMTVEADGSTSAGGGVNPASGYSLLEADSLDAAAAMAKGCPILLSGGTVEVGETVTM